MAFALSSGTKVLGRTQLPSRATVRTCAVSRPQSSAPRTAEVLAAASSVAVLLQSAPALAAAEEVQVDGIVSTLINAVQAAGEFAKSGISVAESGLEVLKQGYDTAAPIVQQGVQTVTPYVQSAIEAAKPAVDAAGPVLQSTVDEANKAIQSSGLNIGDTTAAVTRTASEGLTIATPIASKVINFLTSTDPVLLGEYALGALAVRYLGLPALGLFFGTFRGFKGELAAAAALDTVVNTSAILIDLRTQKEKEASGVPDVPSSARDKSIEVEYAVTEDKRLRSQLRDPAAIEAQVTALQIASLKRVSKGSTLILLDRNSSSARTVAKELAKKGYGKVYVISGGFDGWVQSKLQIKPSATVLNVAAGTRLNRKALPAPRF